MDGLIFKFTFLISLLFSTTTLAQSVTDCVSHKNLEQISQSFSQFKQFVGNKTEYCEKDMNIQWLKIANSLAVLINTQPNEPTIDQDDAFTYKAITEQNWWGYFTKRANRFVIQNNCPQNVVAYVQPFFGNGAVNLCLLFFDQNVSSQASVMMHEVRHFDGFSHVTCTQGNENGVSGACDSEITGKGSYAISLQTLVGMARSKDTKINEKSLLEAEALYMAFNKFNVAPKVKLNDSIILSNNMGDVYKWSLGAGVDFVKTLPEPAHVINSANNLTIYPFNANSDAYRTDKTLEVQVDNPGLYAKHYNQESPQERAKYKSISYFGTGGILKGNSLLTLCDTTKLVLGEANLDSMGTFVSVINISLDEKDQKRESFLLADNGDLYRYDCLDKNSTAVNISKTELKITKDAAQIVDSFGFNGEQYALMDDGKLAIVSIENNLLELEPLNLPVNNTDWLSATPFSQPEVF